MDSECGASGSGKTGYFKMLASGFDDGEDLLFSDSEFSISDEDSDVSDDDGGDEPVDDIDNDIDITLNISTNNDPNYKPVWTSNAPQFGVEKLNFTGTPGINNDVELAESVLEIFELLFTNEICEYIANMTNKYDENVIAKKNIET